MDQSVNAQSDDLNKSFSHNLLTHEVREREKEREKETVVRRRKDFIHQQFVACLVCLRGLESRTPGRERGFLSTILV